MKKIVIIGCGPKALALYAKNKTLTELGYNTPEIIVIEKSEVGGNWSGKNGYTDGKGILGISPFKDLGYPYQSIYGKEVDIYMERYSFTTFLKTTNTFTAWVDGGSLPILHTDFTDYLVWASEAMGLKPLIGEVCKIAKEDEMWQVTYKTKDGDRTLACDAIVVTGPGEVRQTIPFTLSDRIFDAKIYWTNPTKLKQAANEKIALLGGGISAGSVFENLISDLPKSTHLDWYTRRGIFTRSENFSNNQMFSHTENWTELSEENRKQFVQHTDRGSIDSTTSAYMARHHNQFKLVVGEPTQVDETPTGVIVTYHNDNQTYTQTYDRVIMATGFSNTDFLQWLPQDVCATLPQNESEIGPLLLPDFSIETCTPKIHLPMLAWYKYGIGLSLLSCLSTLSDSLLAPYVSKK